MGMGCQRHAPAVLPPEQSPFTHCAGSWVDLEAGLDVYGKSLLPPELELETYSPKRVGKSTNLSRPLKL